MLLHMLKGFSFFVISRCYIVFCGQLLLHPVGGVLLLG